MKVGNTIKHMVLCVSKTHLEGFDFFFFFNDFFGDFVVWGFFCLFWLCLFVCLFEEKTNV